MTPRQLFEAFVRFIDMPITGVEQEHDDVLFEVHSADPHGDVEVRLVRQLSLHDRDENYLGMETISIELLFSPPPSDRPTNETIWADHDRPGTWANDVRVSNGFGFLLANQHGPHTVWISQGGV